MKIYNPSFLLLFLLFSCNQAVKSPQTSQLPDSVQHKMGDKTSDAIIVFKSADGGQTWQDIGEGLPKPVNEDPELHRNVSFANDSRFYLTNGNGLYNRKPDATAPFWTKVAMPNEHSSITSGKARIIAYNDQGRILQKMNGTGSWSPVCTTLQGKKVFCVFESVTGSIFIGTERGLFKSTDNGKTHKQVYANGFIVKVAESGGVLMAVSSMGIISSTDDGENWDLVFNEERRGFVVESIKGGFAVGFDKTASENRKIQTTFDGGKTWQPIDGNLPASNAVYSIIQFGENFFCAHPEGIFRSADNGKTWKLLLPSIANKVFSLSVSGNVIYAMPQNRGC